MSKQSSASLPGGQPKYDGYDVELTAVHVPNTEGRINRSRLISIIGMILRDMHSMVPKAHDILLVLPGVFCLRIHTYLSIVVPTYLGLQQGPGGTVHRCAAAPCPACIPRTAFLGAPHVITVYTLLFLAMCEYYFIFWGEFRLIQPSGPVCDGLRVPCFVENAPLGCQKYL